jgi:hypothetical protein
LFEKSIRYRWALIETLLFNYCLDLPHRYVIRRNANLVDSVLNYEDKIGKKKIKKSIKKRKKLFLKSKRDK